MFSFLAKAYEATCLWVGERVLKAPDFLMRLIYAEAEPQDGLWMALERGDVEQAREFIRRGADVNAYSAEGTVPLHVVLSPESARLLLKEGADPNAPMEETGFTPLHLAHSAAIMSLLLEHGADVHARSHAGSPPCMSPTARKRWRCCSPTEPTWRRGMKMATHPCITPQPP